MNFSAEFLAFVVNGALMLSSLTATGLGVLLIRDIAKGNVW